MPSVEHTGQQQNEARAECPSCGHLFTREELNHAYLSMRSIEVLAALMTLSDSEGFVDATLAQIIDEIGGGDRGNVRRAIKWLVSDGQLEEADPSVPHGRKGKLYRVASKKSVA